MGYILECDGEADRLESQALQLNYSIEEELKGINVFEGAKVLDAGCGTGVLSRYLFNNLKNIEVDACDGSEIRIAQAKALTLDREEKKISYTHCDIGNMPFAPGTFDYIFCRFVYEYLLDPQAITNYFFRLLKKGGTVCLIDLDGVFLNIFTKNKFVMDCIDSLKIGLGVDLYVGRKLVNFVQSANFTKISSKISVHNFSGCLEEHDNNRQRCAFARHKFIEVLGNADLADRFITEYLEETKKPETVLFHNKFIVTGKK